MSVLQLKKNNQNKNPNFDSVGRNKYKCFNVDCTDYKA